MSEYTDNPADNSDLESSAPEEEENQTAEHSDEQKPIASELLALTDDFAEFSADCAFLCDAFAVIAEEQEDISDYTSYGVRRCSDYTSYGVRRCSDSVKEQVIALDRRIHALQRRVSEQD
ncbi:hypothetical protein SG34_032025 [Thalassomonas viridans]|uniref:Uncharacterized protein n=1 Tax=Thalassomonas viridans TaxID=137584 RepID=A0AAE9Z8N7_9GAMM|nr:hypothetical protein [Thalassomonas viridans]WDE08553.1 hypothetical protein SG34_032025 [Thalassomonas viridans]